MIKKPLLTAILLTIALTIWSIPAKKEWQTITLADGSRVKVMLVGDEHGHWFVDEQGNNVTIENGKLSKLSEERLNGIKANRISRIQSCNERRMVRLNNMRNQLLTRKRSVLNEQRVVEGKKRGIVILVQFSNKAFAATSTKAIFEAEFNEIGYSKRNHIGSVHDYFFDQSYGKLDVDFDIVGPVTLTNNYEYYGSNDVYGDDRYPCKMVTEAIKQADKLGVDFSKYDWDGDKEVDQVFIIYAGYGENATSDTAPNNIWPHEWSLSEGAKYGDGNGAFNLDGVKINVYAATCELSGSTGNVLDGIGTACHEFSHCLGFPDTYDSSYSGGAGMMSWDLLCDGSYNGPLQRGEVPAGYTSYERWMAGWLEPIVLDKPCNVTDMPSLVNEPRAYIIYNDANENEFYLLENRQNDKWDYYVGGKMTHGMLITHIDYDKTAWAENTINAKGDRQRMTFFPADNSYGTLTHIGNNKYSYYASNAQMAGDPFPGSKKVTSFTDSTTPAAIIYNRNNGRRYMGKPITDIQESAEGLISFKFMGGVEDGIQEISVDKNAEANAESLTGATYNIAGQRVELSRWGTNTRGIIIKGKKKMLVGKP